MTTEQSHETSADHSCGCGHDHGESHETPKPQEVVVSANPKPINIVPLSIALWESTPT